MHNIITALNDYLAFEAYNPPISNNQDHYDLGIAANLVAFLDSSVEWCGRESARDAISFIRRKLEDLHHGEPGNNHGMVVTPQRRVIPLPGRRLCNHSSRGPRKWPRSPKQKTLIPDN